MYVPTSLVIYRCIVSFLLEKKDDQETMWTEIYGYYDTHFWRFEPNYQKERVKNRLTANKDCISNRKPVTKCQYNKNKML